MADFGVALRFVLSHEGGWSDDPLDHGGATNYGITLALASRYGISTKEALKAIEPQTVADIYRSEFWRFGQIKDDRVGAKVFDLAVNMGPRRAVKILQTALSKIGDAVPVDGVWGQVTLGAVNAADSEALLQGLCQGAQSFYEGLVTADPRQAHFLHGWVNRAWDVPEVTA